MILRKKKAVIFCSVVCEKCDNTIAVYYKNAKSISNMKKALSGWNVCWLDNGDIETLCPACQKKA